VPNRIASDLSGLRASPFKENQEWREQRQLLRLIISAEKSVGDKAINN
jgi:hypothetical protein